MEEEGKVGQDLPGDSGANQDVGGRGLSPHACSRKQKGRRGAGQHFPAQDYFNTAAEILNSYV